MRVLLVRLSAMGDLVHCLGAIETLAGARPDLELYVATQRSFAPLLEHLEHVHAVLTHQRRPAVRGAWRTLRALRRQHFDIALDLQGNWKSAIYCWLSRARRRVGCRDRREPASRVLLTEVVATSGPRHPARMALAVVRALAPAAAPRASRLVATADEIEREAALVGEMGVDPNRPFRVLVWTAVADPRSWQTAAMLRETVTGEMPALWLAGPAEERLEAPPGVTVLRHCAGELRRLVALGGLLARSGGEVLGPDRGAVHVLAACGVRTAVLFGPQDPARTAPVGATVLVRRNGPPCVPCSSRHCGHAAGPVCMDFTVADARDGGILGADGSLAH